MTETLIGLLRPTFRAQDAAAEEIIALVSRLRDERDAALGRVVELEALVSELSGAAPPRDVDSETAFEADMRLSPGLFKRVRE